MNQSASTRLISTASPMRVDLYPRLAPSVLWFYGSEKKASHRYNPTQLSCELAFFFSPPFEFFTTRGAAYAYKNQAKTYSSVAGYLYYSPRSIVHGGGEGGTIAIGVPLAHKRLSSYRKPPRQLGRVITCEPNHII